MNTVQIDPAALAAEAAAAVADLPPDLGAEAPPGEGEATQGAAEWDAFMPGAVSVIAAVVLPQWQLTKDEQRELASSLGQCLAQLFPDGLNGRYACWFRLIACAGGIAVTRYAANGMQLPPFGPKLPKAPDDGKTAAT